MKRYSFTIFYLFFFVVGFSQFLPAENYIPGQLYVKFKKAGFKETLSGVSADEMLEKFGAIDIRQAFNIPVKSSSRKISPDAIDHLESLASIKRVRFRSNLDMEYVAKKLSSHPDIEYAEPVYVQKLCYLPNDPGIIDIDPETDLSKQEYLKTLLEAPEAWEIAKGDTSIVIAIVDSGTDWNHQDLLENVWTNPGEKPDDGIDNDVNDYVDDVHGWDFYGSEDAAGEIGEDNDPTAKNQPHGTHVAGIAAAVTDNGIGVASLSYNVRYMPVKVGPDEGEELYFGFEGILYAALNFADIINCSWGSSFFSRAAEEVIQTATSMGCIVVASAGNSNTNIPFYPAAYPNVLGVGSIDLDTTKSSFSNYGSYVDVSAPGSYIYSTLIGNEYGYSSGTSMSAPVVSALAALIKSNHDWDSDQIQAQIVGTALPIAVEDPYKYLCGCGYINAKNALGDPVLYIDIVDYEFTDKNGNNNGLFNPGEEIEASITVRNYGEQVDNVSFDITSLTGFTIPEVSSVNIGFLEHGQEKMIPNILFTVSGNVPYDIRDFIRLEFDSDGSKNFGIIDVVVNPSYVTFTANTIELSVDGGGRIGYVNYVENSKGSPFIIHNDSPSQAGIFNIPLLFEGGLLFGNSENRISDCIRGANQRVAEKDFILTSPIQFKTAPDSSKQEGTIIFSDEGAGERSYTITATLKTYAYNETGHDQYIIFAYNFKNESSEILTDLRAGLFFDFDIPESRVDDDYAFYSYEDDILVITENASDQNDKLMVGATVLGSIDTPWIIENASEDSLFFGIYDGFTEEEKWRSLSAGKNKEAEQGSGDVSMVLSPGGFPLEPGAQKQATFILAYGLGYDDLKVQISNARTRAEQIVITEEDLAFFRHPEQFSIKSVYPNPFN
ncbi:MAG TPA: S8 family serine peptidase, partial [Desulfobacterales bacterium]|nr:S8 family serine peptidase [Desulfobacterales bacterium]